MKRPIYPDSIREEVVRLVQQDQLGISEAKRKYKIGSYTTIYRWIRKFETGYQDLTTMSELEKKSKKELIKRLKELERQLEDEKIRSTGYSKMIDIAEEQLKISIRKKSDTK